MHPRHIPLTSQLPTFFLLNNKQYGDACTKTFGECGEFMECKKYGNIKLNKSSCQCSDGYLPDSDRLCSKY